MAAIWDSKKYNRINWRNRPSTATALGATNLNKIDVFCNDVDNALIQMDAGKLNIETANSMLASVSFNQDTGIFTFKELNGTTYTYDLNLEKIPVSFTLTEEGVLIMTTEDGTEWECNIADLIKDYVFDDSETIAFEKEFVSTDDEGKGSYHVSASVKAGSINETHLDPDYRADILTYTTQAQTAANDSLTYSKDSKRWAVGDSEYEGSATDNAKYYKEQAEAAKTAAEQARDEAQAATGTVIATTEHVGVVKPDGLTISIDEDGTIHGPQKFESDGYVYVENSDEGTDPAPDPELDADKLGGVAPEGYVKKSTDLYTGFDQTTAGEKAADAVAIKNLHDELSEAENINATDTYGILVSALGQSNVQALIDEIADRVMNQLVAKSMISNVQVNDQNHIPASSLVYSMNQDITELSSDLQNCYSLLVPEILIPNGSDLNDYTTPGQYYVSTAANSKTIENCPYTLSGFKLTVEKMSSDGHILQTLKAVNEKYIYYRTAANSNFNGWLTPVTNADLDVWVNQTFATQQKISAKHWVTLDTGVVIPSGKTYKVGVVVYTGNQFVFPLNVYVDSSNRHVMAELSNVSDTEVTVQFAIIRVCYGN